MPASVAARFARVFFVTAYVVVAAERATQLR